MLRILGTTFAALLGLAFGSFLNVCLSRWPEGESVVKPASHCRTCARTLRWWENIPVFSWIFLRGRCRTCGTQIHWRYPLVEAAVGLLWAICVSRLFPSLPEREFTLSFSAAVVLRQFATAILCWLLVALAALDAENLWLPDFLTLPGIGAGLLYTAAYERLSYHFDTAHRPWHALMNSALAALAAAALILVIRWIYWLIRRKEGIGLGDAKLMALLAAWLGLPGALLAFFLGVVLGAIVAVPLLLTRRATSARLPLGTFLCIGGIVSALWGEPILATYLKWAGF
jgi:leader peptidase (prepilin peptidase) / N-methyltransferase